MAQVSKEHYHFSQYTGKTRWTSYWHQLDEVLKTNSSSVLVVGVGDGIVPGIIALMMENPEGAVHYAGTQRKYLDRYLLDGRLEISNNRAERRVKPFVIGRKNWLFANTPKAPRPARSSIPLWRRPRGMGAIPTIIWRMFSTQVNPKGYRRTIAILPPGVDSAAVLFDAYKKDGGQPKLSPIFSVVRILVVRSFCVQQSAKHSRRLSSGHGACTGKGSLAVNPGDKSGAEAVGNRLAVICGNARPVGN